VSSRQRQERADRARRAAERAATARRRRWQWLTTGGSVAGLLLVLAGMFWVVSTVTNEDLSAGGSPGDRCRWVDFSQSHLHAGGQGGEFAGQGGELRPVPARHPDPEVIVDVGLPPEQVPRAGTQLMTIGTNLGTVEVEIDLSAAPCTAASFAHLAGERFFDGSYCHRMFPGMLQCGDPNAVDAGYRDLPGIGTGGPSYEFDDENLPTTRDPVYYPAGTVAMASSGPPDTNGSQFFFIYRDLDLDGPKYSVVGQVVAGMEMFGQVDEIGHDASFATNAGGGRPNQDIIIETLRVGEPRLPATPVRPTGSVPASPAAS
jgi:peptidyl-prolyl cis-trans isomerase B (cyclophilin B)